MADSTTDFNNYIKELEKMILQASGSKAEPAPAARPSDLAPVPVVTIPSPNPNQNYIANLQSLLQQQQQQPAKANTIIPPVASATSASVPIKNKLKLLLVSTHCHQVTGYSKVSYNLIKQLSQLPWLQVTHFGFQRLGAKAAEEGRAYPSNVEVIDAAALEKQPQQGFGYAALPEQIQRIKPHIVMVYNDMAVIANFMEAIKKSGIQRDFRTWLYVDQVYTCQLQGFIEIINREADRVFAFTNFWRDCLKEQWVHRPIDVIAHGFDDNVFKPIPKSFARRALNLPENVTLLLSINRNQPRKRYDLLIMAFVELIAKYPSKQIVLLCVCDKGEKGGWNLFEIFARELKLRKLPIQQFGNRLMISSKDMEFRDEDINMFYNAADMGVATADGEGFGLCTFESMGVGVPQVVPDVGGFKEFCRPDNSVIVKPKFRYYLPSVFCPVGGEGFACDPHDICMGIETYINDSDLREKHGTAGMAAVKKYTWASVTQTFINRLRNAQSELEEN